MCTTHRLTRSGHAGHQSGHAPRQVALTECGNAAQTHAWERSQNGRRAAFCMLERTGSAPMKPHQPRSAAVLAAIASLLAVPLFAAAPAAAATTTCTQT